MKTGCKHEWKDRFRLRAAAARVLYDHAAGIENQKFRTVSCGKAVAEVVNIYAGDGGVHFSGIETCGSVWTCPVCSAKIAAVRTGEVTRATEGHTASGGAVYFLTLTAPHFMGQDCKFLRDLVAGAWRRLIRGAPWKRLKAKYGIEGYIRALETKHGGAGWHNHLHIVLLTGKPVEDLEEFRWALFDRWAGIIERMDGGLCSPDAMDLHRVDGEAAREMGWYLAKMGLELTQMHLKGMKGGMTPFQLLERGDRRSRALFREYAHAFKGARHLTWSRGLKDRFDIVEITDQEIAAETGDRQAKAQVSKRDYNRVRAAGKLEKLVEVASNGGQAAVDAFLVNLGVGVSTRDAIDRREFYYDGVVPESREGLHLPMAQKR